MANRDGGNEQQIEEEANPSAEAGTEVLYEEEAAQQQYEVETSAEEDMNEVTKSNPAHLYDGNDSIGDEEEEEDDEESEENSVGHGEEDDKDEGDEEDGEDEEDKEDNDTMEQRGMFGSI